VKRLVKPDVGIISSGKISLRKSERGFYWKENVTIVS
jgi:hypothetical protein